MTHTAAGARLVLVVGALAGGFWAWDGSTLDVRQSPSGSAPARPAALSEADLWMAPAVDGAPADVGQGVARLDEGDAAGAIVLLSTALTDRDLAPYAAVHVGRAQLALEDYAGAISTARRLLTTAPQGYVRESGLRLLAEALEGQEAWDEAATTWKTLAGLDPPSPAGVYLRLAQAADKAGDRATAGDAFVRVYYEWPLGPEAATAEDALTRFAPPAADVPRLELARAGALYAAGRYDAARTAYERARPGVSAGDRALVDLRLAVCDVRRGRYAQGLRALTAVLDRSKNAEHRREAEFFQLAASRGLKRADHPARVQRFVAAHPASALAEAALNDLATAYILDDDDGTAAEVFTQMYERFPSGAFADRAAWKAGWWAYRSGNHREVIRVFESAALAMKRADYRPAWLYWAARSHAALKEYDSARLWFRRTIADYRNSYYGREAARALGMLPGGAATTAAQIAAERDPARAIVPGVRPAIEAPIERLLSAGLYDDAVQELRRVQRLAGSTPVIEATVAYALNRRGDLRPAITAMRRAYPQFMSDGGERLPVRLRRVIFPVAHYDLIKRYAASRNLDLHLVTALVAQESTFQADVRSVANAWGLMQLLPSTGRRYAARLGVRGFSTSRLTDPEFNVRLGTAYLADLIAQFGDTAPALAAYNAGEHRVERWQSERPGLPRDEFVDDIPFPETQNYVKRILGTAEDYRLLYGTSTSSTPAR